MTIPIPRGHLGRSINLAEAVHGQSASTPQNREQGPHQYAGRLLLRHPTVLLTVAVGVLFSRWRRVRPTPASSEQRRRARRAPPVTVSWRDCNP
ncbi:hypothetical protein Mx4_p04 [Myxococcus phage Mx4]|nr:hypothetical protein Mx4_p04 [Myxococcus phage Mx4]